MKNFILHEGGRYQVDRSPAGVSLKFQRVSHKSHLSTTGYAIYRHSTHGFHSAGFGVGSIECQYVKTYQFRGYIIYGGTDIHIDTRGINGLG